MTAWISSFACFSPAFEHAVGDGGDGAGLELDDANGSVCTSISLSIRLSISIIERLIERLLERLIDN